MNKAEIFDIWAPATARWSPWAKPVLFAHLDSIPAFPAAIPQLPDIAWARNLDMRAALVLDLPGAESVWLGLALTSLGFRPVPLYNAVPMPGIARLAELDFLVHSTTVVNVSEIMTALTCSAEKLAAAALPLNAPPAFLLDAHRRAPRRIVHPSQFDNRSICFTTDFPSATFLIAQGIQRVVLVQRSGLQPQADLAQVLRRWQDTGLYLERLQLDVANCPEPFHVFRPAWYGTMFQRALAAIGLRRSSSGGFGAWGDRKSVV